MASGISSIILSSDLDEFCEMLKLVLQEKQAGKICNIIDEKLML